MTLDAEHPHRVLASSASLDDAAQTLGIDPGTLDRTRNKAGL